jgi:glycosyltransferase involved in cell wall biosynthesis
MGECQVSVVIPCYRAGKYLSEAIDSVLAQESRVSSLEVVVVDNHSPDDETRQVLASWRRDGRVRIVENAEDLGPAGGRNVGIGVAGGKWVAFLDADDVWLPGALEARWQAIESEPDAEWIGADFRMWYEDGSLEETGHYRKDDAVGRILAPAYESGRPLRLSRPVSEFLRFSLAWIGTVMVKRELLLRLGGFEPSLRVAEDVLLWYRLASVTDFFFVPRIVALYRQHPASLTSRERRGGGLRVAWDRVYTLLRSDPAFRPYRGQLRAKVAAAHERAAYYHRARGEAWQAARAAARALTYTPARPAIWKNLVAALLQRR